jgi:hypothetical protein
MPLGLSSIALLLVGFALTSCYRNDSKDRVRKDSPLFLPAVQIYPEESWQQRIKDAVLQQLPIGSERSEIDAFIQKNFVGIKYHFTTSDDSRALAHLTEPHVFIRTAEQTSPGIFRVEIYLLLTSDERLKNVVVKTAEAYP